MQLCLPQARIVADHFHVIQHVGKALKKVIGRGARSAAGKQALEGHRHLFLRNQENLSAEDEQSRATLAQAFPEIAVAGLRKALSAFRDWRQEILAFFDFLPTRLSHGFVEGKNNRTKAIMRQAYG